MSALVEAAFARCLPHWGGEFLIALHYFAKNSVWRSNEKDQRWLQFQIWKEWYGSGVYGPRGVTVEDVLRQALQKIRLPSEREDLDALSLASSALDFGQDELSHFILLYDLWRKSFPEAKVAISSWGVLPAGQRLTELRYQLREEPLGEIAVRLSEGGGLGLFFGILHALSDEKEKHLFSLSKKGFTQKLLFVVQRILEDETHHLIGNFVEASRKLQTDIEINYVVEQLDAICAVKLQEREEQFGLRVEDLPPSSSEPMLRIYQSNYLSQMYTEIIRLTQGGPDEV